MAPPTPALLARVIQLEVNHWLLAGTTEQVAGTDNLNTLFWSRSGSVTTTLPTAIILCQYDSIFTKPKKEYSRNGMKQQVIIEYGLLDLLVFHRIGFRPSCESNRPHESSFVAQPFVLVFSLLSEQDEIVHDTSTVYSSNLFGNIDLGAMVGPWDLLLLNWSWESFCHLA
jgi:hypothetical protein